MLTAILFIKEKTRIPMSIKRKMDRGDWVAQLVKCPTLDFGSGHDLTVGEFDPHVWLFADSVELAWDCLSPSLSLPLLLACFLSQSK